MPSAVKQDCCGTPTLDRRRNMVRLVVQENTGTAGGAFNEMRSADESWTDKFQTRGIVENLAGREVEWARQLAPTSTVRVSIPWPRAFTLHPKHRVKVLKNNRILAVEHVNNVDEADQVAVLLCSEAVAP